MSGVTTAAQMACIIVPDFAAPTVGEWARVYERERQRIIENNEDEENEEEPVPAPLWLPSDEDGSAFFVVELEQAAEFAKLLRWEQSIHLNTVARELEKVKC